jgi:hypothetical protein
MDMKTNSPEMKKPARIELFCHFQVLFARTKTYPTINQQYMPVKRLVE